eukprot:GHVU01024874.1.p1 GENE.GHVU01024874.1~~GHVU01024874.1.p1  ORF type:complete len:312 (+),score=1.05 GHVU01024874.1:611-1546(+)
MDARTPRQCHVTPLCCQCLGKITTQDKIVVNTAKRLFFSGLLLTGAPSQFGWTWNKSNNKKWIDPIIADTESTENGRYLEVLSAFYRDSRGTLGRYKRFCSNRQNDVGKNKACYDIEVLWLRYSQKYLEREGLALEDTDSAYGTVELRIRADARRVFQKYCGMVNNNDGKSPDPKKGWQPKPDRGFENKVRSGLPRIPRRCKAIHSPSTSSLYLRCMDRISQMPLLGIRTRRSRSASQDAIFFLLLPGLLRTLIKLRLILAPPRTLRTPDMLRTMFHPTRPAQAILQVPDSASYVQRLCLSLIPCCVGVTY